jgi:DNA-damage-inducible protein J
MRASTSVRLDSDVKEIAVEVFKQYGMSLSDGINLFCRQVAMTHSIPFELKVPNERMQKALDELNAKKGKKFDSMDELKKDLLS